MNMYFSYKYKTLKVSLSAALLLSQAGLSAAPVDIRPITARDTGSRLAPGWQQGAFMEIFVRGYADSNGDGIGDLRGLISKLDYLKELGVKGLWLMPITASSDHDHGYATTDFRALEPDYGGMADLDELLKQAHRRGIGVIMDYVVNHSSKSHPLFELAASSPGNTYRDWFVWQGPAPNPAIEGWDIWGKNPWTSTANGAYFGTFGPHMPDFNLKHPAVREYHRSSLRFWLNRGLDGFRLDAVPHLIENDAVRWNDQPESRALTNELRRLITAYKRRHVVCEATANPTVYAAPDVCGSAFAFGHEQRIIKAAQGDGEAIKAVADYFNTAPLTMATMLSNHDIFAGERVWDQLQGDLARYKLAAATYLLQPGTPFIYYGEEIGMAGVKGLAGDEPLRTPMSWTSDLSGFSASGKAFRPLSPNATSQNAKAQAADPDSILNFYKVMLKLRNGLPAIARGDYRAARAEGQTLSFQRVLGRQHCLVAINYAAETQRLGVEQLPERTRLLAAHPPGAAALLSNGQGRAQIALPAQSLAVYCR
ncbi:alpha-amylase family glycosyl hydrolase [Roseateles toxinivorans]|uniref:Glycosidase n=1 Tax=Roseateles toxinivorans TaxID=270368 RepID=A0A4R6QJC4_9BURK|nr:alpha-amylase family glycosyl hydrolase [Roseateles toxinivorans]TDP63086.1 glycosidase [Roseateles toxinivorans]